MSNRELSVINAVLAKKDVPVLFSSSADDLFTGYGDVWAFLKNYYYRYHLLPDVSLVQENFPDFDEVETKGEAEYYLNDLKEHYIKTRLEQIMTAAAFAMDDSDGVAVLNKLQAALSKLNRFSGAVDVDIMDFEIAEKDLEEVREKAAAMGGTPGIQTGIGFIDSAYPSGFAGGELVVILGYTGRGKSLLTTLISCNAMDYGFKPMCLTLEMSAAKMRNRAWTMMGSGLFRNSSLELGEFQTDNFAKFKAKHTSNGSKYIVVTNDGVQEITPNVIQAKIDEHKPAFLVADYAQLCSDNANTPDMTARMRNFSKEMKRLAVANDIPVILISSATPEGSASLNEPPRVEQVAWSKQLCYDADLAIAVHRHTDTNIFEVVCRKNRNGDLFAGYIKWDIDNGIYSEVFDPEELT